MICAYVVIPSVNVKERRRLGTETGNFRIKCGGLNLRKGVLVTQRAAEYTKAVQTKPNESRIKGERIYKSLTAVYGREVKKKKTKTE